MTENQVLELLRAEQTPTLQQAAVRVLESRRYAAHFQPQRTVFLEAQRLVQGRTAKTLEEAVGLIYAEAVAEEQRLKAELQAAAEAINADGETRNALDAAATLRLRAVPRHINRALAEIAAHRDYDEANSDTLRERAIAIGMSPEEVQAADAVRRQKAVDHTAELRASVDLWNQELPALQAFLNDVSRDRAVLGDKLRDVLEACGPAHLGEAHQLALMSREAVGVA